MKYVSFFINGNISGPDLTGLYHDSAVLDVLEKTKDLFSTISQRKVQANG